MHHKAHDAPRSGEKKMIYKTVTEEDGSKNATTFRPADLHDDQNGADTCPRILCTTAGGVSAETRIASYMCRKLWKTTRGMIARNG
jgi:hypothetical protein